MATPWPDGRSGAGTGWPEPLPPDPGTAVPWPGAPPDHALFTGAGYPVDPSPSLCGQLGLISPGTLARFACNASFERAVLDAKGVVLELGQAIRLATPAQRRAVSLRDGGCIRPGCNRPATWCDIHHVIWFSRGGPTDLANLAALCPSCHSMVHAGLLEVTMIDGLPYVRYGPTARNHTSLNPTRGNHTNDWIRNTYFDALNDAKTLAHTIISAGA